MREIATAHSFVARQRVAVNEHTYHTALSFQLRSTTLLSLAQPSSSSHSPLHFLLSAHPLSV